MINKLQDKYVPSRMTTTRYSQPWITRECKQKIRQKKRAYNKAKKSGLKSDWETFSKKAAMARKSCKMASNEYVRKSISGDGKCNPKKFYSYIKNKKRDTFGVAPLRENGILKINNDDKARILNNHFSSVFSIDDQKSPVLNCPPFNEMPDIVIELSGVV